MLRRLFSDLLYGRQQEADQDGDDRDDHEKFDQREPADGSLAAAAANSTENADAATHNCLEKFPITQSNDENSHAPLPIEIDN